MEQKFFSIEHKNGIVTITLQHPPSNALNTSVLTEFDCILDSIEANSTHKVVVLSSTGRFFCPGADVHELKHIQTAQKGKEFSNKGQALLNRLEALNRPVLAAIQGACLGGGLELAMACHLRLAAQKASFGLPEITLGLIPGFGGTQRLPRIIGSSKATELILTGSILSANDALALGLVNRVLPASALLPCTHEVAERIKDKSLLAIRAALSAIRAERDTMGHEGLAKEAELFGELCETRDAKEGIHAFLEKRPPNFRDQ